MGDKVEKRTKHISMQKNTGFLVLLGLILIIGGIIFCFSGRKDALAGTWNLDGTTVYQFDGKGEGAMILPGNTYSFVYTMNEEKKTVSIDFKDENATDDTYSYRLEDNILTLYGNVGEEKYEYIFQRQEN